MATDYAECPLYKSKTYYGVVLHGTHKHIGWSCYFVGDGAMKFKHDNGDLLDFYRGREVANWMEKCWADFLAMAERHNAELSGPRPLAAEGSRSNAGLGTAAKEE